MTRALKIAAVATVIGGAAVAVQRGLCRAAVRAGAAVDLNACISAFDPYHWTAAP